MSTTAMPIVAIAAISFQGMRAGGPGDGQDAAGGVDVIGCDDAGYTASAEPSWRSYAARRTSSPNTRYASLIADISAADAPPRRSG
jgi:hypothetical protein